MQLQSVLRLAVSASAVAMVMAAAPAHAQVVTYTGPPIPIVPDINGLYLNVVSGASANGSVAGWDINIYNNQVNVGGLELTFWAADGGGYVGSGSEVSLLAPGTVVGPASSFLTTPNIAGGYSGLAFTGTTGFFGFRFLNGTGASATTHFGWAELSGGPSDGFPAAILSYAFQATPNMSITVVPEPATYALMALGLAAVGGIAARRRKAANTTA